MKYILKIDRNQLEASNDNDVARNLIYKKKSKKTQKKREENHYMHEMKGKLMTSCHAE